MLVCKCDKCGEEFDMEKGNMLMTSMQAGISLKTRKYDLCDKCWNDFNLWIRGHANFVPKTKVDEFGQSYCCVYDDGEEDSNICLECKEQLQKPTERDCEHCVHHKDKGCESWECHFERRTDADSN